MPYTTDKDGKPVWVDAAAGGRALDKDMLVKGEKGTTAGKGLGKLGSSTPAAVGGKPMPKPAAGESYTSARMMKAMAEWRSGTGEYAPSASPSPSAASQADALRKKKQ